MEGVDQVELGQVDEIEAYELGALDLDRVPRVIEGAAVDRVEVVRPVGVGVVAVHHHHELLRGRARLLRVDDQRAVQPLVDVFLERRGVAVVELHAVGLRLELVGEATTGRHDLEDAVHVRRVNAVKVDRVRVRARVDEVDSQGVAFGCPEDGTGNGAVVGPGGEEDARRDLDFLVDRGERVLADASSLVRESLGGVEQGVEVVRAADGRRPGADHRGVSHRGVRALPNGPHGRSRPRAQARPGRSVLRAGPLRGALRRRAAASG